MSFKSVSCKPMSADKIERWRDLLVWRKAHAALLLLAKDLGLLLAESYAPLEAIYTEVSKMTNALLRSLKFQDLRS